MTVVLGIIAFLLTLLALLLIITAGVFALSVVLSFAVAWYERVNSDPTVEAERRHALAARLMISEYACLLGTLLMRPLGWLPARIPAGPSRKPPVILLHGLFQNRSSLLPIKWRLRAAGFDRIVCINTPAWRNLDELLDSVVATVETVRWKCGRDKVFLVGHSMGGILARGYLLLRNGAPQVAACVTIGSPHLGSKLAPFAVSRLGRNLLPGSGLLAELNGAPPPEGVRMTAIYSRHDNIIVPMENARLAGAENLELTEIGHTAMLFSAQVTSAVVQALENHGPCTAMSAPDPMQT